MNYTESMVRDALCRGLEDTEIQMDLLSDKNQDMTLEETLKFVEAKEAGKRSASRLMIPQAANAMAGSTYKKQGRFPGKEPPVSERETCTYCGTKGHGKKFTHKSEKN